jgi:Bacteriophage Sf6, terminase small subunit-like
MPAVSTIVSWVIRHDAFHGEYLRARQCQAHVLADEILGLIDGLTKDIPEGQGGMPMTTTIVLVPEDDVTKRVRGPATTCQ